MNVSEKTNWIYVNEDNNSSRYVLGEKGSNPLIVFGVNPSTAEPNNLDKTLTKIKKMMIHHSFDGWIMLNIYPQRATNPKGLDKELSFLIHKRNLVEIKKVLEKYPNQPVVAAWGNIITIRSYLIECLREIFDMSKEYRNDWLCFDTNLSGNPKHPLYISVNKSMLKIYEIENEVK